MKSKKDAPFIRLSKSNKTIYLDILTALFALVIMSYFYFGSRVFVIAFLSIFSAMASSYLGGFLFKNSLSYDFSPAVTGLMIALLLPAGVPYYVPVTGSAFAILVAKIPFGGTGRNIFNPAAAGFCLVALLFPKAVFTYPAMKLYHSLPLGSDIDFISAVSPAETLKLNGLPGFTLLELFIGRVPGPLGAVFIAVLVAGFTLIASRRQGLWHNALSFLFVCAAIAFFFLRVPSGRLDSVIFELSSGALIFSAFFMVSDPTTSPHSKIGKVIFGGACGMLTMLISHFGGVCIAAPFAIIIMNPFSPLCDRLSRKYTLYRIAKREGVA